MSFKVEIEIKGCDGEYCGDCYIDRATIGNKCPVFAANREFDDVVCDCIRCPECLEAEKEYKEKENERTTG